jgi:hypothetical protein
MQLVQLFLRIDLDACSDSDVRDFIIETVLRAEEEEEEQEDGEEDE